jgi:hypothetical protein
VKGKLQELHCLLLDRPHSVFRDMTFKAAFYGFLRACGRAEGVRNHKLL